MDHKNCLNIGSNLEHILRPIFETS